MLAALSSAPAGCCAICAWNARFWKSTIVFRFPPCRTIPLRGHQLGYRPKVNAYDGWTPAQFEQYIRDLAVFGTNAIELIPPRSDDQEDSPHFPLPKIEMMVEQSRICKEYGIDVWIWYPAMDKDYSDPATVEFALKEWAEVFRRLPRIDAILVPGGDPGHTRPKYMMALLEKQTQSLHKFHPTAQMWMSPQSFSKEWMAEWFDIMKQEPSWLSGVAYGPQTRITLPEAAGQASREVSDSRLSGHHRIAAIASIPCPIGTLPTPAPKAGKWPIPGPRRRRGSSICTRNTPPDSSPIRRA